MLYLAYISFLFISMQIVTVLLNFVFRQKLLPSKYDIEEVVSVLIPVRNEEQNIKVLLEDLREISTSKLEIIIYDDQSSDNTAKVVQELSITDKRIKLLQSENLPHGWLGKNHACYQLAQKATGKHYLFIDADVRLNGNIIKDTVAYLKKYNLGLLSIFPTQMQKTFGEKISVPIMNYILLTLLPLIFVRISPFKSHAAANGQFMLFNAATYDKIQPHMLFKKSAVEDISIARFFKKQRIKIACITGEKRIRCRMYKSYREALNGFSKNVFMFFGNIPVFAFLFWLFAAFGIIPIAIVMHEYVIFYILGIISIQFFYSIVSKQNFFLSVILFPFQLIFLLQILVNAIFIKRQKKYLWKERRIN